MGTAGMMRREPRRLLPDTFGRGVRLTPERTDHNLQTYGNVHDGRSIGEPLASLNLVVRSSSTDDVALFYESHSETPVGPKYVCVPVKIASADGFVITAYLTDRTKQEVVLWQRSR